MTLLSIFSHPQNTQQQSTLNSIKTTMPHPRLTYTALGLWAGWSFSKIREPTLGLSMSVLSVMILGLWARDRLEADWTMVPLHR